AGAGYKCNPPREPLTVIPSQIHCVSRCWPEMVSRQQGTRKGRTQAAVSSDPKRRRRSIACSASGLTGIDSIAPLLRRERSRLPDPHRVEQHAELRIERVIAYPLRNEIGVTQRVEGYG